MVFSNIYTKHRPIVLCLLQRCCSCKFYWIIREDIREGYCCSPHSENAMSIWKHKDWMTNLHTLLTLYNWLQQRPESAICKGWTTCISPKKGVEGVFDGLTQLVVSPKVVLQYVCTYVYILGVCDPGWTGRWPLLEHCKWNVSHLLLFTYIFRWITVHEFILVLILLQCWHWLHWTVRSKQFYEDGCLQWSTQHWPIASHLAPIYVVCWICKDMKHEGCPWSPHSESVLLMICTSH